MVNFIGKLFQLTGESWSLQLVNNQSKNISEVLDQKEKHSNIPLLAFVPELYSSGCIVFMRSRRCPRSTGVMDLTPDLNNDVIKGPRT